MGAHSHSLIQRQRGEYTLGCVQINVITIFPEFFESPFKTSLLGKAIADGVIDVSTTDLREFGLGKHRQVDDEPFGGGAGMVMRIEPIAAALGEIGPTHRILLTPAGKPLEQQDLIRWSTMQSVTLICGRYEGVDNRVAEHLVEEEISLGDFVLMGGEVAAAAVVEAIARLLPGTIGNPLSPVSESFADGLVEEPHYTRPAEFEGWGVPDVLLSGDHGAVAEWRQAERVDRTRKRRPDLWERWVRKSARPDAQGGV